jgi:hypothetical protein
MSPNSSLSVRIPYARRFAEAFGVRRAPALLTFDEALKREELL